MHAISRFISAILILGSLNLGFGQSEKVTLQEKLSHTISMYYHGGSSGYSTAVIGMGIEYFLSYPLYDRLNAGIAMGFENFNLTEGEIIFPVGIKATYRLGNRQHFPLAGLTAGHGFASSLFQKDLIQTKGGYSFHPQFGYQWNFSGNIALQTSLGYRLQKGTFTKRDPFFDNSVVSRTYDYRRLTFNLAINF